MKRLLYLVASAALLSAGPAAANAPICVPGPNWTSSWTGAGQTTTYSISAPPCVYVNVPFNVTLTVTDSFYNAANGYPTATVGMKFSVLDTTVNGTVTLPGSSGATVTVEDGLWVHTFLVTYTSLIVNHSLQFQFVDFGDRISQGMWWTFSTTSATGTLLDPYPPGTNTAPAVDAGADLAILGSEFSSSVVTATASDAEGDALTYRWLDAGVEIQAATPVEAGGGAPLFLDSVGPLALGTHNLTVEVSDGTATASDEVLLTVLDSPPAVTLASGVFDVRRPVSLSARASDFDGGTLTYTLREGTAILASGAVTVPSGGAPVTIPLEPLRLRLGSHLLTASISDGVHVVEATAVVVVRPPARTWTLAR
jgi:hypothetical protein